jgi:hypothetical protein
MPAMTFEGYQNMVKELGAVKASLSDAWAGLADAQRWQADIIRKSERTTEENLDLKKANNRLNAEVSALTAKVELLKKGYAELQAWVKKADKNTQTAFSLLEEIPDFVCYERDNAELQSMFRICNMTPLFPKEGAKAEGNDESSESEMLNIVQTDKGQGGKEEPKVMPPAKENKMEVAATDAGVAAAASGSAEPPALPGAPEPGVEAEVSKEHVGDGGGLATSLAAGFHEVRPGVIASIVATKQDPPRKEDAAARASAAAEKAKEARASAAAEKVKEAAKAAAKKSAVPAYPYYGTMVEDWDWTKVIDISDFRYSDATATTHAEIAKRENKEDTFAEGQMAAVLEHYCDMACDKRVLSKVFGILRYGNPEGVCTYKIGGDYWAPVGAVIAVIERHGGEASFIDVMSATKASNGSVTTLKYGLIPQFKYKQSPCILLIRDASNKVEVGKDGKMVTKYWGARSKEDWQKEDKSWNEEGKKWYW